MSYSRQQQYPPPPAWQQQAQAHHLPIVHEPDDRIATAAGAASSSALVPFPADNVPAEYVVEAVTSAVNTAAYGTGSSDSAVVFSTAVTALLDQSMGLHGQAALERVTDDNAQKVFIAAQDIRQDNKKLENDLRIEDARYVAAGDELRESLKLRAEHEKTFTQLSELNTHSIKSVHRQSRELDKKKASMLEEIALCKQELAKLKREWPKDPATDRIAEMEARHKREANLAAARSSSRAPPVPRELVELAASRLDLATMEAQFAEKQDWLQQLNNGYAELLDKLVEAEQPTPPPSQQRRAQSSSQSSQRGSQRSSQRSAQRSSQRSQPAAQPTPLPPIASSDLHTALVAHAFVCRCLSSNRSRACCTQCEDQVRRDIESEVTEQQEPADIVEDEEEVDDEPAQMDEQQMGEEEQVAVDADGSGEEYGEEEPDAPPPVSQQPLPQPLPTPHPSTGPYYAQSYGARPIVYRR